MDRPPPTYLTSKKANPSKVKVSEQSTLEKENFKNNFLLTRGIAIRL